MSAGFATTANAYASVAIGRSNVIEGDIYNWVDTDPLFVIGNGSGVTSDPDPIRYRNAFAVYKNGDAYFSGTLRVEARGDIPMFGQP